MKRSDKEQLVADLSDKIKSAKVLYYTDFTGLNVKRMTELRRRFRRAGVEYVVIKNTLAARAATDAGLDAAVDRLRGPTGVVIGSDAVIAAKVLADFAKENEQRPEVKGGMLEGKVIDAEQVKKLALLPSRDQMLAELGAGLQSPLAGFVGALSGLMYMFIGAVDALKTQRESAA
jgi:large subunit ribosomal protein L10